MAETGSVRAARRGAALATIRPYRPADRAAVRAICCKTAFRNMGSDALFEDRQIHADYWTSYYTDHRPQEAMVVERDGTVIGYFFGCSDQAHYLRVMALRIVPWCLARTLWRLATGRYHKPETRRYIRHMLTRAAREAPPIDTARFPAHYHCNILRAGYGGRFYTELVLMFLDRLEAQGITTLHGHITEPLDSGIWQRFAELYQDGAADAVAQVPTTLFRDVLGDPRPMVNRVWGVSVAGYRNWILWLRETRKL